MVIVGLIEELPGQYADCTSKDQLTFERTKHLWDELGRDEMFQLLERHEAAFDK